MYCVSPPGQSHNSLWKCNSFACRSGAEHIHHLVCGTKACRLGTTSRIFQDSGRSSMFKHFPKVVIISFQERQWGWKSVASRCRPPLKARPQRDRCPALSWLTHYQHLIVSSESKRKENLKPTTLISTILSRQTKEQDCVWTVGRRLQVLLPLIIQRTFPFCCRIKSAAGELHPVP